MAMEFLGVCWELKKKIEMEKEKLKQQKMLITSITSELDGMPRSQDKASKVEKLAVSIIDTENKILSLKEVFQNCLAELAEKLIDLISNSDIRQVILYRYGYCKLFRDIGVDLRLSERRIYDLHSMGLKILKNSAVSLQ